MLIPDELVEGAKMDWLKEQLGTNYGPAIVAGAVALVVGLITGAITLCVAWLNPSVTSLRMRRQFVESAFDKAVATMLMVQTSRHLPTDIDPAIHQSTDVEHAAFTLRLREASIEKYFTRIDEAKIALVAIVSYFPDVEDWLDELQFPEIEDVRRRQRVQAARIPAIKRAVSYGGRIREAPYDGGLLVVG